MNKEYVQQYVSLEKEHWWFLVRKKIITVFLKHNLSKGTNQPLRILNIGVSGGETSRMLSDFGNVVSVETDPYFIEYLNAQQFSVTSASIANLPFEDNSFDLVCAFDVMEHVEKDDCAMKEMTRVCKEGASICITVPAFKMLWGNHDIVNGHFRRYTRRSLKELFLISGNLRTIKTNYFNFFLFLPILIARKTANLFNGKKEVTASDFTFYKTSGILNRLFYFIFRLEIPLINFIPFPFGVSLISFLQKKDMPSKAKEK